MIDIYFINVSMPTERAHIHVGRSVRRSPVKDRRVTAESIRSRQAKRRVGRHVGYLPFSPVHVI
jgi:hypothetical protein